MLQKKCLELNTGTFGLSIRTFTTEKRLLSSSKNNFKMTKINIHQGTKFERLLYYVVIINKINNIFMNATVFSNLYNSKLCKSFFLNSLHPCFIFLLEIFWKARKLMLYHNCFAKQGFNVFCFASDRIQIIR